ncbi:hypothetical protein FOL46_005998 [Perkinsus olseni]|uniref:Uncharacterized protein n=1 Tax=Perkinsus olseni TaxID=32597 RepID=A0A7J6LN91_PEROL|nr:hypothetical protein FOL46_005998 [Perkinsus olseni]
MLPSLPLHEQQQQHLPATVTNKREQDSAAESSHGGLEPDASSSIIPPSPVYYASAEEFDDPYEFFIKLHAKYGQSYGVVIIKPPPSWLGPWRALGDPLTTSPPQRTRLEEESSRLSTYRIWKNPTMRFRPRVQHISQIGGLRRQDSIFEKKLRLIRFIRGEPLPFCAQVPHLRLSHQPAGGSVKRMRLCGVAENDSDEQQTVRISLFTMFNSWREHRGDWEGIARASLRLHCGYVKEVEPRVIEQIRRIYDAWIKGYESYILNPCSALADSKACCGEIRTTAEAVKLGDTFCRVQILEGRGRGPIKYTTTVLRREKKTFTVENVPSDGTAEGMRSKDVFSANELLFLKANGSTFDQAEKFSIAAEDRDSVALCEACCLLLLPESEREGPHLKCLACDCTLHVSCLMKQYPDVRVEQEMDWFCPRCVKNAHRDTSLAWLSQEETGFGFDWSTDMTMANFVAHNDAVCEKIFGAAHPEESAVEEVFWRVVNCGSAQHDSPEAVAACDDIWYGNDLDSAEVSSNAFPRAGSPYFLAEGEQWSLRTLPLLPDSVLNEYLPSHSGSPLDITGVTRPWVYLGSALSAFCWHAEDQYLYSINCHHAGAAKIWYSVPGRQAGAMEDLFRRELPTLFNSSPDLTQHMTTMMDPKMLLTQGLLVTRGVQRPGDIVLTLPGAYHGGLNAGVNLAEAVNVPARDWITMGSVACRAYTQLCRRPIFCFDDLVINICRVYATGEDMHPLLALQAMRHLQYIKKQRTVTPKAITASPRSSSDILARIDPDKPWLVINTSRARRTVSPLGFRSTGSPASRNIANDWYIREADGAICCICRQFCSIVAGECRDCGLVLVSITKGGTSPPVLNRMVYCNLHIGACCGHPVASKLIHNLLDSDDLSKILGYDLECMKSEGELTPTRPERRAKQNAMKSWKSKKSPGTSSIDNNSTLSSPSSPRSALALRVDISTISSILEERESEGIPWRFPMEPPNADWLLGLKERCGDPWETRVESLLDGEEPIKFERLFDLLNDVIVNTTPVRCSRESELIDKLTQVTHLRFIIRSALGMKQLSSRERGIHIKRPPTTPAPDSTRGRDRTSIGDFVITGTHEALGKFRVGGKTDVSEALSQAELALTQARELGVTDLPEEP